MVAFVMAYSFTEPQYKEKDEGSDDEIDEEEEKAMSPPIMVPLADALNHITKNNAKLTFGEEALKMVTTRPIKKVISLIKLWCSTFSFVTLEGTKQV